MDVLAAAFRNKIMLVRVPLSAYFLFSPNNLTCASSSLRDENAERVVLTSADIQRKKAPSVYECLFREGFWPPLSSGLVTIVMDRSAFGWIKAELASAVAKNDTQPMKSSPFMQGSRTLGRKKRRAAVTP